MSHRIAVLAVGVLVPLAVVSARSGVAARGFPQLQGDPPGNSMLASDRLIVGLKRCQDGGLLARKLATQPARFVHSSANGCLHLLQVAPASQAALARLLQDDSSVAFVEPDARASGAFVPNDPDFNDSNYVYGPQQINAPAAWDFTRGDPGVTVALVDTGIDLGHVEFSGRILSGYDYVNLDSTPQDDNGHGTHVAGIVAAALDNGVGIAGIAGGVHLLPMKALDASNTGWWSDIALAIMDATDRGAQIINLSLGGTVDSLALRDAVQYAVDRGVLVVAAAGNDGSSLPYFPASYENVLGAGATDQQGSRWSLSNYGVNVKVVAPGFAVYSTHWRPGVADAYTFLSGTSMAAAHVTGGAALLWSFNPLLTRSQIVDYLLDTAVDLDPPGADDLHGYGRIDLGTALAAARADLPTLAAAKQVNAVTAAPGATLAYTVAVGAQGDGLLTNVVVTDALPAGLTVLPGSVNAGGVVSWTAGTTVVAWALGSTVAGVPGVSPNSANVTTVVTLTSVADTYIQASTGARTVNSGAGSFLQTHVCCTVNELSAVGLVRFDLGAIPPGAAVARATLGLYETLGTAGRVDRVVRLLTSWMEGDGSAGSGATWETRNGNAAWAAGVFSTNDYDVTSLGTITATGTAAAKVVTVTAAVDGWVNGGAANNGIALVAATGAQNQYLRYRSREWTTPEQRPSLRIEYAPPPRTSADFPPTTASDTSDGALDLGKVALDDGIYDPLAPAGSPAAAQDWNWTNVIPGAVTVVGARLSLNVYERNLACAPGGGGLVLLNGGSAVATVDVATVFPAACASDGAELSGVVDLFALGFDTPGEINNLGAWLWWGAGGADAAAGVDSVRLQVDYGAVVPARAARLTAAPSLVAAGDLVTVTLVLSAGQSVANVVPSLPVVAGSDGVTATLISGPNPDAATVGGGDVSFRWVYRAGAGSPGQLVFGSRGQVDRTFWPFVQSNGVLVAPPLTFRATVAAPAAGQALDNVAFLRAESGARLATASNVATTQVVGVSSSYTLTARLLTPDSVKSGDVLAVSIRITNTGQSWLAALPLRVEYSPTYLNFIGAQPAPKDFADDGQIDWDDLAAGLDGGLAPGTGVETLLSLRARADTTLLPGSRTQLGVTAGAVLVDADGPGGPLPATESLNPLVTTVRAGIFNPTVASAVSVWALAEPAGVRIRWTTTDETRIVGFALLRSAVGGYAPLHTGWIPAQKSGQSGGAEYEVVDTGAAGMEAVGYRLTVRFVDGEVATMDVRPAARETHLMYLPALGK